MKNRQRRNRYIEDWELEECFQVASPMLQAYIVLKFLTGLRRGDLLRLKIEDLKDDGIHVRTSKTDTRLVIQWTSELRAAAANAIKARPKDIVPRVFCTRNGDCYVKAGGTANAFDSLWQRFMSAVLLRSKISQRFQEKDLRKKTASDMNLLSAQRLLGHTDSATTKRHYRITPDLVLPHTLLKRRR